MPQLIHRRALLRSLFAAPAIVAAGSLMPISTRNLFMPLPPGEYTVVIDSLTKFDDALLYQFMEEQRRQIFKVTMIPWEDMYRRE